VDLDLGVEEDGIPRGKSRLSGRVGNERLITDFLRRMRMRSVAVPCRCRVYS
jgi:hypothetical protein